MNDAEFAATRESDGLIRNSAEGGFRIVRHQPAPPPGLPKHAISLGGRVGEWAGTAVEIRKLANFEKDFGRAGRMNSAMKRNSLGVQSLNVIGRANI